MNDQTVSEKIVRAGESVNQALIAVQASVTTLSDSVVTAVIESKKARKIDHIAQELREARMVANQLSEAMKLLEMAYGLASGTKPNGAARKSPAKTRKTAPPKAVAATPKKPRVPFGKANELVMAQVFKVISHEWRTLQQVELAKLAGVSAGSVNAALKRAVAEGVILHQGKEYKLPDGSVATESKVEPAA
jgi:hypothetical protein